MISIVDFGAGNLANVRRALEYLGCECTVSSDRSELDRGELVVFPGVGAAGTAMAFLRERGLEDWLSRSVLAHDRPFIGICLGMQLLFEYSEEDDAQCLAVFPGIVKRLPASSGVKVPHIGWNHVNLVDPSALSGAVPASAYYYFVHSYYASVDEMQGSLASTLHGVRFSSMIRQDNIVGMQFHPEKSGDLGLELLRYWLRELGVQ